MRRRILTVAGAAMCVAALTFAAAATVIGSAADQGRGDDGSQIQHGLEAAPVPLNLDGKNRALVALGSYMVNGVGDCNGCHHGPSGQFAPGGDPYLGQPEQINQAAYLAGGTPLFGPFFIPRNLTPDKTGRPAGGATFEEFREILKTGVDPDSAHPQFGPLLQVMPWPALRNLTDNDIRAIYAYLSAIPCIEGDPGLPNPRPIGTRCQ